VHITDGDVKKELRNNICLSPMTIRLCRSLDITSN